MKLIPSFAALTLLGTVANFAADGRIPISSAPYTISAPGHYYLTQNLSVNSGNAITISAGGVELNLNGHRITNNGAPVTNPTAITVTGASNVRIRNGMLSGGNPAVRITPSVPLNSIQLETLQIDVTDGMAVYVSGAAEVRGLTLDGLRVTLSGVLGVNLLDLSKITGGLITGNQLFRSGTTGNGINLYTGTGVTLAGNAVWGGNIGMYLGDCSGMVVEKNLVRGATNSGIYLSGCSDSAVRGNTVNSSGYAGIYLTDNGPGAPCNRNAIDDNVLMTNGQYGLNINSGSDHVFARNRARGSAILNFSFGGTGTVSGGGNCADAAGACF